MTAPRLRLLSAGLVTVVALAGCSLLPGGGGKPTPASVAAQDTQPLDLQAVCPNPVVIQTDWNPEAEYGASYHLIGPGYRVDTKKEAVRGPLVVEGRDTGVDVEVRDGGPVIKFQSVAERMYADKSITLGLVNNEQAAQLWTKAPMTSVVAPLDISPGILLWDPKTHPDWNTVVDIGQTDEHVLVTGDDLFPAYLVGSGILRRKQIDRRYDGSTNLFLGSKGKWAQGGFATAEPWILKNQTPGFDRDVSYQLIHDTGFQAYTQTLAIRAGDKGRLAGCLRRLVPIIQRSIVDYIQKPGPTNQLIENLVKQYHDATGNFWSYPAGLANFSIQQQRQLDLVGNGPDQTIGNFDMARVQSVLDIVRPILAGQKTPLPDRLSAGDLATNEFIDPKIGLPAG
jgi:hypothetical protein